MSTTRQQIHADVINRIVKSAILAPSAENIQPWSFAVANNSLSICLDTSRSLPSDVGDMLSLTGVGACLENAVIAAREEGYEPSIQNDLQPALLDQGARQVPIATISLNQLGEVDPLYSQLATRCTSRRMEQEPIEQSTLDQLASQTDRFSKVRIEWVTDSKGKRELGELVGMGNRIRFEHKAFHQEFYHNVRFTPEEAETTRDGLDLATLQLPFGVSRLLTFLRKWPRMQIANALGFSRGVARQAAQEVHHSGVIGLLTVENPNPEDFVEGGRALERVWLAATQAGLGCHPAAALAVFLAHAQQTDGTLLSARHWQMIQQMQERYFRLYPSSRTLQMVFRIGQAPRPKVRSLRKLSFVNQ